MKTRTLLLACASLTLVNCATIFRGTNDTVTVKSNPENAAVYINGLKMPSGGTFQLKKGFENQTVSLKKEGYEEQNFMLQKSFDPISILNVFVPVGFLIDIISGAMMKYDTTHYVIDMEKKNSQASARK